MAYEDSEQASLARFRNNVAYRISPYGINLPSALNLTKEDIQEICRIVKQCLER
jgi:perosamine synthetase